MGWIVEEMRLNFLPSDIQIIALWLGHEQIETTQVYLSESLTMKRKALRRTQLVCVPTPKSSKVSDLSFLDDL